MANRVSQKRGVRIGIMWTAIRRDNPPEVTDHVRVNERHLFVALNDLMRGANTRDARIETLERRIRFILVSLQILHLCQQLRLVGGLRGGYRPRLPRRGSHRGRS